MQAFLLDPSSTRQISTAPGAILAEEVTIGRRRAFHKGHLVETRDLALLATAPGPIHAVRLASDDVHEDDAGRRLAAALAGPGVVAGEPRQSRVNLAAAAKGLLRIDADAVTELNLVPDISVFTLYDRLPVVAGRVVAGAKITPVAIAQANLAAAEAIAARGAVVQVKPFLPLKIGVVTTEGMADGARERFRASLCQKIGWYGGSVLGFKELPDDPAALARAIQRFIEAGADVVLTGGGNTIDPLDAALQALPIIDAEMIKFGAPSHPGSMFWLAYRDRTPIFNLASCSMYSGASSADLVLPWVMAGERVTERDLAELGHGGLLERADMNFRFPPYDDDGTGSQQSAGE